MHPPRRDRPGLPTYRLRCTTLVRSAYLQPDGTASEAGGRQGSASLERVGGLARHRCRLAHIRAWPRQPPSTRCAKRIYLVRRARAAAVLLNLVTILIREHDEDEVRILVVDDVLQIRHAHAV